MEDLLSDVLFSNPFKKEKKNTWVMNLKNQDLDLNWNIHSKYRFFEFMIRFWILVRKKAKNNPRKIRF